jgi:hypothetical protein
MVLVDPPVDRLHDVTQYILLAAPTSQPTLMAATLAADVDFGDDFWLV